MEYIVLFLFVFLPYLLNTRVSGIEPNVNKGSIYQYKQLNKKAYFIMVSLFMIVLLTLRHDFVGTDTQNYRILYDIFSNVPFKIALQHINDIGFVFLYKLLSGLGCNFRTVLFLQALFYICSVTFIIKRYSKNPALSYWIFITFGFFIFATTMRQAIATAFILLSYDFIKKRKMFSFIICVGVACTFHISAIVFLPAYWMNKFNYSRKTLMLITFIITFIIIFNNQITSFILSFSKTEYVVMNTGGYFLALYIIFLLLLGVVYHKSFIVNNNDNKMLFFMIAAGLALIPIARINPAVFRITYYYQIFTILYVPNLIATIHDRMMKFVLTYGFMVLGLYYFYFKLESYGIRMHPYVFYWSEYPNLIPGLN